MMMHLGIWSRHDPYAPMLDELLTRLEARGYCFATLRERAG
jgi:peptidoglycan/xylan/chitin deacetylase (PgdA/CDA1 family)